MTVTLQPHNAIRLSLAVSFLMLAGKGIAAAITNSRAILSDAAESMVHLVATGVAGLSMHYARRPADSGHLYGHQKVEHFSSGFEGAVILCAGLGVVYVCAAALIAGPQLRRLDWGVAITSVLAAINLALGLLLVRTGRRVHSPALVANGRHVLADMWTSISVVVGVSLAWTTGISVLDPIAGLLAGLHITYMASGLLVSGFAGLMDRADPEHSRIILKQLEQAVSAQQILGFHQLRHRGAAAKLWVDVHLLVPGALSTRESHCRASAVEASIRNALSDCEVSITTHVEPAEEQPIAEDHPVVDPLLKR